MSVYGYGGSYQPFQQQPSSKMGVDPVSGGPNMFGQKAQGTQPLMGGQGYQLDVDSANVYANQLSSQDQRYNVNTDLEAISPRNMVSGNAFKNPLEQLGKSFGGVSASSEGAMRARFFDEKDLLNKIQNMDLNQLKTINDNQGGIRSFKGQFDTAAQNLADLSKAVNPYGYGYNQMDTSYGGSQAYGSMNRRVRGYGDARTLYQAEDRQMDARRRNLENAYNMMLTRLGSGFYL